MHIAIEEEVKSAKYLHSKVAVATTKFSQVYTSNITTTQPP